MKSVCAVFLIVALSGCSSENTGRDISGTSENSTATYITPSPCSIQNSTCKYPSNLFLKNANYKNVVTSEIKKSAIDVPNWLFSGTEEELKYPIINNVPYIYIEVCHPHNCGEMFHILINTETNNVNGFYEYPYKGNYQDMRLIWINKLSPAEKNAICRSSDTCIIATERSDIALSLRKFGYVGLPQPEEFPSCPDISPNVKNLNIKSYKKCQAVHDEYCPHSKGRGCDRGADYIDGRVRKVTLFYNYNLTSDKRFDFDAQRAELDKIFGIPKEGNH